MKKIFFASVVLIYSLSLSAQYQNEFIIKPARQSDHNFSDFVISVSPDLLFNTPNGVQFAGGLKLKMFLGKRFSFDSDLVLSRNYAHFGPGLVGIPIWLLVFNPGKYSDEESRTLQEILWIGLFMALSIEHTSYNIPVRENLDISPYVSFLRIRESSKNGDYNDPGVTNEQACFATGLEVNRYFNRFLVAPYSEYSLGYKDMKSGFNTGIYFGYYFPLGKK
jgi:hypothetical protein